mmetsp:Transcript_15148/g.18181  ORF Transcript_15148/g.18181 Transcript_15148/m.18181 type:complete len:286 (-) Transcript_15148:636-1493(-)
MESPDALPAAYEPTPMENKRTRNRISTKTTTGPKRTPMESAAPVSVKNAAFTAGAHPSSNLANAFLPEVKFVVQQPATIHVTKGSMYGSRTCEEKKIINPRVRVSRYEAARNIAFANAGALSAKATPSSPLLYKASSSMRILGRTQIPKKTPMIMEMTIWAAKTPRSNGFGLDSLSIPFATKSMSAKRVMTTTSVIIVVPIIVDVKGPSALSSFLIAIAEAGDLATRSVPPIIAIAKICCGFMLCMKDTELWRVKRVTVPMINVARQRKIVWSWMACLRSLSFLK